MGRDSATPDKVEKDPGRSLVSTLGPHMYAPKHVNMHARTQAPIHTHACKENKTDPNLSEAVYGRS